MEQAQLGEAPVSVSRVSKWVLIAVGLLMVTEAFLHRGGLLYPLGVGWSIGTYFVACGAACALLYLFRAKIIAMRTGRFVLMLLLPFPAGLLGPYYARCLVEIYAFWGVEPVRSEVSARVKGFTSCRGCTGAVVQPSPDSRELRFDITDELYHRLDPYRQPGRDCLALIVETGRSGIQRVLFPNMLEAGIGLEALRPCAPTAPTPPPAAPPPRPGPR